MTQYERNELARQARETGLCMKCGKPIEDREALTKDGKTYASCISCRPSKKPRVNERDTQNPKRAYDPDDVPTHFESTGYAEYLTKVEAVVRYIDGHANERYQHTCLNDIHNVLGRQHSDWTLSALNAIKARPLDMIPERYTLKPETIKRLPLSEAKPFQPSPRYYKVNEQPAGMPPRLSI